MGLLSISLGDTVMGLRIFKTRHFHKWMRKTELTDALLARAIAEMAAGLVDADLGGGVFKKRIALPGRGKSGSVRTLVATRKADRWIFLFGYEKSERSDITPKELRGLQGFAADLLSLSTKDLAVFLADGALQEIEHEH